jgi:hypothetical protein
MRKPKVYTSACHDCLGTGKKTISVPRKTRREASREWQSRLRKARRIERAELDRLVRQHREALLFGACKATRVGEMGAFAELAHYLDKHGGEHAVLAALATSRR